MIRRQEMTRSSLLILMVLFFGMPAFAMIRTLPFPELVQKAEVIVIASVDTQQVVSPADAKIPETSTFVKIEKILKGTIEADKPLQFNTPGSKDFVVRDRPRFPIPGERVVLFLVKNEEGSWRILNGVQGLWPVESGSDKTLGMGFNYSIRQIEEELAR